MLKHLASYVLGRAVLELLSYKSFHLLILWTSFSPPWPSLATEHRQTYSFFTCFTGNVPCPIIYGYVVDWSCTFWEKSCGKRGACRLYDLFQFRVTFHGLTAFIMFLAFITDMLVWANAGSIKFEDDFGEEKNAENKDKALPQREVNDNEVGEIRWRIHTRASGSMKSCSTSVMLNRAQSAKSIQIAIAIFIWSVTSTSYWLSLLWSLCFANCLSQLFNFYVQPVVCFYANTLFNHKKVHQQYDKPSS